MPRSAPAPPATAILSPLDPASDAEALLRKILTVSGPEID
jgi:hypothetical protein